MVMKLLPLIALHVTPLYDVKGEIFALEIWLRCERFTISVNEPLVSLRKLEGNIPMSNYDSDKNPIVARDREGRLELRLDDGPTSQQDRKWHATRDTEAAIVLSFVAYPTNQSIQEPPGLALHKDQHGLSGGIRNFIPRPVFGSDIQRWRMTVDWNLEYAPSGTKGTWLFGDGSKQTAHAGTLEELYNTHLAVSPSRGNAQEHVED